jgi:hypothetical protein
MSNKLQLAFELTSHSFTITEIRDHEVTILNHTSFSSSSEREMKQAIQLALSVIPLTEKFEEFTLSWVSKQCVVVPTPIFKASSSYAIYSACFSKEAITNDLDYNVISEGNCVTVFEIPLWLKSFFILHYPRIIIQHAMSHTLRSVLEKVNTTEIHLAIYSNFFHLVLVKGNQLLIANTYDFTNEDDLLYYISFCIQQNELSFDKGFIHIHLSEESDNELVNAFYIKWKTISNFKSYSFHNTPYSLTKQQLTCV